MPKFQVIVKENLQWWVEVEAADFNDAEREAFNSYMSGEVEDRHAEVDQINRAAEDVD
jgi:hypothetical protein